MLDFSGAYPCSRKVYVDGPQGVQVPMREIALSGGEPPLRVYDTSGPHDHDVSSGLPKLRDAWVRARTGACVTQLHFARKGEITQEMEFIAIREGLPPAFVRDEVATFWSRSTPTSAIPRSARRSWRKSTSCAGRRCGAPTR